MMVPTKRRAQPKLQVAKTAGCGALAGGVVWLLFGGVLVFVVMIGAALVAIGALASHLHGERTAASTKGRKPPHVDPKAYQYRSSRQRKRIRQREVLHGQVRSGTTRVVRTPGCSSRCQGSRMPAMTCRCACGGKNHGQLRGVSALVGLARPAAPVQRPQTKRGKPIAVNVKKPTARGSVPAGPMEMPLLVTWKTDDGTLMRVNTTRATALVLLQQERLVAAERA